MWKPIEVVPEHRNRAVALWLVLIVAVTVYTSLLVRTAVNRSKNPSTSLVLSKDAYKYPEVYVCLYELYGCDLQEDEDDCVYSSSTTQGGPTTATFNPGEDNELDIPAEATLTNESINKGFCVKFDTSVVEVIEEEQDPEEYIRFDMYWYPGGSGNASTTCINEAGAWDAHSESVYVFLRDAETGYLSAGIQVPYSCMTSESDSHLFTYMGIGLTKEVSLSNAESSSSYNALATSSVIHKDERDESITGIVNPYAYLSMEIARETDSLEVITEVDPLQIAEIFGNVGGFWVTRQDPHVKSRNFKKSVTRGAERVVEASAVVGLVQPLEHPERSSRVHGRRTNSGMLESPRDQPQGRHTTIGSPFGQRTKSTREGSPRGFENARLGNDNTSSTRSAV